MIESVYYSTPRISIHALQRSRNEEGETILFLHGNASSSVFWKQVIEMLPENYNALAPDFRGYGKTEDLLIDATKGFDDQANDILGLLDHLKLEKVHVAGHSMAGGVIYTLMARASERLLSATLVNPVSPYGFGGTKGIHGEPIRDDFAGTGAGVVNPEFAKRMGEGDRSEEDPNASPRMVMNYFFWKPPFRPEWEEELLTAVLEQKVGDQKYPGDAIQSGNWPGVAPGIFGPVNATSPKYISGLANKLMSSSVKVPVLWIRGAEDQIVSNESLFDVCTLGKMDLLPGYPGEETCPPQPMVDQTRFVLKQYAGDEGELNEIVMQNTGHSPFIEQPVEFMKHFSTF